MSLSDRIPLALRNLSFVELRRQSVTFPLDKVRHWLSLTRNVKINRENDRIEGDVGL
jgi:hypothetical protein